MMVNAVEGAGVGRGMVEKENSNSGLLGPLGGCEKEALNVGGRRLKGDESGLEEMMVWIVDREDELGCRKCKRN